MRFQYKEHEKVQIKIFSFLAALLFKLKEFTYSCKNVNYPNEPCIFALWHAHQCGLYSLEGKSKTNVMISRSKDGEIIARAAEIMGLKTVRGSITRGGASATLELVNRIKKGDNGAITVDGPKGPNRVVKKGIIEIAKMTGVPIVPITWYSPSKGYIKLNTWDEFRFPLFCRKMLMYYGEPIYVDKNADDKEIENKRKYLEDTMNSQYEMVKRDFKKLMKS